MKKSKILIVITILLFNVVCFAQTGFDDDVEDVPATPINGWVYVAMIAAAYYGYISIAKALKKSSNQEA